MRLLAGTTVLLGSLDVPGRAAVGPKEEAARAQTSQAVEAYNLGHFDEAARHYESAYLLVQDPILLFNLGQAYRFAGKPDRALAAFRSFLRTAAPEASGRVKAGKRIAEMERLVSRAAEDPDLCKAGS
jgi:tetratricopeptide (TPR) repeat protein